MKITSHHLWIDPKYNDLFRSISLSHFKDFDRDLIGRVVRSESDKSISFFKAQKAGKKVGFYVKFHFPKWYQVLKRLLRNRSQYELASSHELRLIRFYQKNNISVVTPVACGEKCIFGIAVSGFLVQEEVQGTEFVELMKIGSHKQRTKLIREYAKLIAELHSRGILSSVVRVTDIICTSADTHKASDISLVIIDREKGTIQRDDFSIDKCTYYLSHILFRFKVYIDNPSTKEVVCFLRTYLEFLKVDIKPSLRDLFYGSRC